MPNRVNKSAFRRGIRPKDQDLYFVQEDVDQGFRNLLLNTPFSNGTILTLDFNTALDQTVAHKLDGAVKGMILIDKDGIADFKRVVVSGGRSDTHINIVASAACKAKFWVWR